MTYTTLDSFVMQLKLARVSKRMTLSQLAMITGISIGTLSNYENGQRNLSLETIIRICDALDLNITLTPCE